MKKIGIKVSQSLDVHAHGAEAHTVDHFCKMLGRRYYVHLIGCEVYSDEFKCKGIFTYVKYLGFPLLLRKILHIPLSIVNTIIYAYRERPDILFIPGGVFYNGLAVLIAGKLFGIKTLVRTAEDHFSYYKYCETYKAKFKNYLFNKIISSYVLKTCDYVLTVGDRSKQYFISKGVRKERIWGIPGPIDRKSFDPVDDIDSVRKKLGIPLHKKVFLYVGAISGVKGTNELPYIIKKVRLHLPDVLFVVVGKETHGNTITKSILDAGGDDVMLYPPMAHKDLALLYQAANALIFLTKLGVGYGQVVIESILSGTPVVAYNSGGDVEWFLGDNCFSKIDLIVDTLVSGEYNAIALPSEFDQETIYEKHLLLFDELMS